MSDKCGSAMHMQACCGANCERLFLQRRMSANWPEGRLGMNIALRQVYAFEDLEPGMEASLARTVSPADIRGFAEITGDKNPVHLDPEFAARTIFKEPIAHGMLTA